MVILVELILLSVAMSVWRVEVYGSVDNVQEINPILFDIRLLDNHMVQITVVYPKGNDCDRLQGDYMTITYEEYQRLNKIIDKSEKDLEIKFSPRQLKIEMR